ncbi:hypothetical protein WBG78_04715 [Chryseolinea sp. T2]|uniref:hypothetical protein n=1 Tax=Chryseolinea sp. T2 TaxID=3129255 RepID=UPI00307865CE
MPPKFLHVVWVAPLLLTSCTPAFYSTVGQNVPLFHNKGEVVVNGGLMSAGSTSEAFVPTEIPNPGVAFQTAVAIDSNVALFANYYHVDSEGDWNVNANYFEVGGGLFTYNPVSHFAAELFAGIGYGAIDNEATYETIDAKFMKYFLQPSIGFSGRVVEAAFTPRLGVVDYLSNTASYRDDVRNYFNEMATTFVFEPGITLRVGFKNFKAQYQMNYSTFQSDQLTEFDAVMKYYGSISFFAAIGRQWSR